VSDMRTLDPGFFARFGEAMQSGEHLRIEAAMDESAALYLRVVQQRGDSQARRGAGDAGGGAPDPGNGTGACVTLYVAGNVAAVVNLAVAWNIAVASNAVYDQNWFWPTKAASTTLAREQAVQLIADRL
jgi:SdpC family antimicrobial peptide